MSPEDSFLMPEVPGVGSFYWRIFENELVCSPQMQKIFGLSTAVIAADSFTALLHPEDRSVPLEEMRNALQTGAPFQFEVRVVVDALCKDIVVRGRPWPAAQPSKSVLQGSAEDLTARRPQPARPSAPEKTLLVTLAGGVAHEINNPLTYVLGNLEFVERRLDGLDLEPDVAEDLIAAVQEARQGAERVRKIVNDLKTYSHAEPDKQDGTVSLDKVLQRALEATEAEIHPRATLVTELDGTPHVLGTELRLQRVFINLLTNAVQAIPEGSPEQHRVVVRAKQHTDEEVLVEIEDTGVGIPAEAHERIFEPFFTSRPDPNSTGLGLAICLRAVKAVGGRMEVESHPGSGSTFRVFLPTASSKSA